MDLEKIYEVATCELLISLYMYFPFFKSLVKKKNETQGRRRIQAAVGAETTAAGSRRASTAPCSCLCLGRFFDH